MEGKKYYQDKEGKVKVIKGPIEKRVVDEVFKHLTDNKPLNN